MAERVIKYRAEITTDTVALQKALKEAQTSLSKISNLKIDEPLTDSIKEAATAAQELQQILNQATNNVSGRFDLSKFNEALVKSGKSLEDYAIKISDIGEEGQQAFLDVASAITKAELPIARTSKLLDDLWVAMKNTMQWQLTANALQGFIGAISNAFDYTKDLNTSLNSIQIVSQKSSEEMADFAENANRAAKALSTTTTNYSDAALLYFQQGLSEQEVEERTRATIKFANVSNETAQEASEQLTAIWNNFDDGSKSLEYYIDVMTALGASTASSSQEISEGIQKFASVADTIGLSYEYAAASLATITATTRESADVVGTALRTLFSRIQGLSLGETLDDGTNLNKYSKALENVGVSIFQVNGDLKSMDTILDELASKWQNLSEDQQMALAQTVAGKLLMLA